jgi:hypothetical protein
MTGALRRWPPIDPKKRASPKLKHAAVAPEEPVAVALGVGASAMIGAFNARPAMEPSERASPNG